MESTFKAPLAGLVLARVQRGADTLETPLRHGRADLLPASPVTQAHVAGGQMTIGDLAAAILERSDNTAANLLLQHAGGPDAPTRFLRGLGDRVTTIRRGEVMGAPEAGGNTTAPPDFAATVLALSTGSVLDRALRQRLLDGMAANRPGRARPRAAFPPGWRGVDRTGTGDGICNDVALFWPPGRAPVVVSAFYRAPGTALEAQEAVLRDIGRMVAQRFA